jgi:hypothetical protein
VPCCISCHQWCIIDKCQKSGLQKLCHLSHPWRHSYGKPSSRIPRPSMSSHSVIPNVLSRRLRSMVVWGHLLNECKARGDLLQWDSSAMLTKRGPSTLIKGTRGNTTEPSGIAKISTSEQSTLAKYEKKPSCKTPTVIVVKLLHQHKSHKHQFQPSCVCGHSSNWKY